MSRLFQLTQTASSQRHLPLELEESCIAGDHVSFRRGQQRFVPRQSVLEATLNLVDLNQLGRASQQRSGARAIERLGERYGSIQMPNGR